ncbi:MAG: ACT domain-containing protein [Colwellia sp.]
MTVSFIVSFAGMDSPNLLQGLAKYTHELDGVWVNSKFSYLEGHVAANIKVSIANEKAIELKAHFMAQPGLVTKIVEYYGQCPTPKTPTKLNVKAKDRPGLVTAMTAIIKQQDAELLHIETHRLEVQPLGDNIFIADLVVNIPEGSTTEDLISALETLDDSIKINDE